MFDTLFGAEMPLAVKFFLAFLVVLGLILGFAWAVRRFGTGRLGGASTRGRQPRLAVIDYASVDGRRRLILVRRDNVEHLLMIGGPTDVVVEPNIVRAVAAPRDLGARPPAGIEALPRALPLSENGNSSWPLQPEPAAAPRPTPRVEPLPDELARPFQLPAEPPPRPQRDTLAALADELSTRPTPPSRNRPPAPRVTPDESHAEERSESRPEPRQEARVEPRSSARPLEPPRAATGAAQTHGPTRGRAHSRARRRRRRLLPSPLRKQRPRRIKAWPTWRNDWKPPCVSRSAKAARCPRRRVRHRLRSRSRPSQLRRARRAPRRASRRAARLSQARARPPFTTTSNRRWRVC